LNLIPVGSTVNKIVRKDNFMIDIILNYNKTTLLGTEANKSINNSELQAFEDLVNKIRVLLEKEFT
jgi:hypothetical protein